MTSADSPYEVRLAPAAVRAYSKLETAHRDRIRRALEEVAGAATRPGRGGKSVKTIEGTKDRFHRLRVGDYRIVFDLVAEDRVLLVLGIVHRSELERWLRNR
ncbi:MAG TPA: type II toxin-antitoxin system RelE/ParE family toxin [Pleomorphomonadaceae bacterium]|nr:type II toxin-antitoxin system RelE/ParE family toxin [Pleomorphomonadaceae bacterium]